MQIPADAIIPREKLTQCLLVPRARNDKSRFLARAGFSLEHPELLEAALRELVTQNQALVEREDVYGRYLDVRGVLRGPRGTLDVVTVWIVLATNSECRFVTLKPAR